MGLRDELEGNLGLYDEYRNPNQTDGVACLLFIIDRRPRVMHFRCNDPKRREAIMAYQDEAAEKAKVNKSVANRRASTPSHSESAAVDKATTKAAKAGICIHCGEPVEGNRKRECHKCTRTWVGQPGKGGAATAELETRHQLERERDHKQFVKEIERLQKAHRKEVSELRATISRLSARAEAAEENSAIMRMVRELSENDDSQVFRTELDRKVKLAESLVDSGWRPQ